MSEKKQSNKKVSVVLFNLGGPDSLDAVKPFLFNLFNDKYIIRLPKIFRAMLAFLISTLRRKTAQGIYTEIGGKSPIVPETEAQKTALERILSKSDIDYQIVIAMRHWYPFAAQAIEEINKNKSDEVILLPLYPQLSSTTSISSIEDFKKQWHKYADKQDTPIKTICCYPRDKDFISAHVGQIKETIKKLQSKNYRILFSAHGLPKKIIEQGDPYQYQVEMTVENIVKELAIEKLDYKVCYQSRVGPMEWLKPNTEDEILSAEQEGIGMVIVPIAFVSEHVETLVELDVEYANIIDREKIEYLRVPTLSANDGFIKSLANMVEDFAAKKGKITAPNEGKRICPKEFGDCPCNRN